MLTTPSKLLRGHRVGNTEYYDGTLRVTYKSKLTLFSFKEYCGGEYEGGGVRSDIQACVARCNIKARCDSFSSKLKIK